MISEKILIKSINKKHLNFKLDCTGEGRFFCQGKCCKVEMSYGRYYPEEIKKLPKERREKLVLKEGFYCSNKDKNGYCEFLDFCYKNPDMKPLKCALFPLKISNEGKLYLARWV